MHRLRESLALALIALLPFHAFFVTVGTKLIAGPGHAPLGVLAVWKEVLLGIILLLAFVEILRSRKFLVFGFWFSDLVDALIFGLSVLAIVVTVTSNQQPATSNFLGFKYDLLPLVSFLILRRVPWSDFFIQRVLKVILISACIIAIYGLLTLLLP